MYFVPDWIIHNTESNTALYARTDKTSAGQDTLLLEGEDVSALQHGAYMAHAAEVANSFRGTMDTMDQTDTR